MKEQQTYIEILQGSCFPLFFANYMLHGQRPTLVSSCKYACLCSQLLSLSNSDWSSTKVRGLPDSAS
jgi:hypothetical protein